MQCREAEPLLPAYFESDLPAPLQEALAAHLHDCSACGREAKLLRRSLEVLSSASVAPAPDLWSQFESRLKAQPDAHCAEVLDLLPAYAAGDLGRNEAAPVEAHLAGCRACAAEERTARRAVTSLERAAPAGTPDLWGRVSTRIGTSVPCGETTDALPAFLEGALEGARARALLCHLEQCESCAAEAASLTATLAVLDRVAARPVTVDLWPAFAERLERERAGQDAGWRRWLPLLPAWSAAQRVPGLRPALGAAFVIALALMGRGFLAGGDASTQVAELEPPGVAVQPSPKPAPGPDRVATIPHPVEPDVQLEQPVRPRVSARRPTVPVGRVQTARLRRRQRANRRERRIVLAARPQLRERPRVDRERPAGHDERSDVVAIRPRIDDGSVRLAHAVQAPVTSEVKTAVVDLVKQMLAAEDATSNPFEGAPDAQ